MYLNTLHYPSNEVWTLVQSGIFYELEKSIYIVKFSS